MEFRTPAWERTIKIAFSLAWFLAALFLVLASVGCVYGLAILAGAPAILAGIPAAVAGVFSVRFGWQLVTAPLRFQIVLGSDAVEIGSGWLRRRFPYHEVEAVSLPEHREGHGVALEAGTNGAFVFLTPDDEARCAAILHDRCKNAIFVDQSGREHLPSNPDHPLMSLGTLYRRNRSLALGSLLPSVFLAALCAAQAIGLGCVLLGFTIPAPATGGIVVVAFKFTAELIALVWLIRRGSERMKMALDIREKIADFHRKSPEER